MRPATTYWFKVRVIDASGKNLSEYSPAVKVTTPKAAAGEQPLRIGSYNIKCSNCFAGLAERVAVDGSSKRRRRRDQGREPGRGRAAGSRTGLAA